MKKDIKKIDATRFQVNVQLSDDSVKNKFEEVYEKISKEAKVKGFRPGKVPRDILEKYYSQDAHQRVIKELIPEILKKIADEEKFTLIDIPRVSDINLTRETLSFKADIEVEPEVRIENYKGIKVKWDDVKITDEDVRHYIDSLREKRQSPAADDDFARGLGYPDKERWSYILLFR